MKGESCCDSSKPMLACRLFLDSLAACARRPTLEGVAKEAASKKLIHFTACSKTVAEVSAYRSICGRIFDETIIWQSEKL